ncbi:hypothetical protein DSECCO2_590870 [anaerobic digester metagenome]
MCIFVCPHLPLNQPQANYLFHGNGFRGGFFVVDVFPLEQYSKFAGKFISLQIISQDPDRVKIVGKLEVEYRVMNFAQPYLFDVLFRSQFMGILVKHGDAAAKNNALKIELFT